MRSLRLIVGEFLIEAGAVLRLAGWFVLPTRHPTSEIALRNGLVVRFHGNGRATVARTR